MGYRTLLQFPRPLRVRLELVEPGRDPRPLDGRLAGFGREGTVHFVEIAAEDGRPAQRLPLGHVRRAMRRGQEVDLRRVILSRAERAAFRAGRRVRIPAPYSAAAQWRNLWVAAVVLAALWVPGFALSRITGRSEDAVLVMAGGAAVWGLASLLLLIPPVARRWADLRLRFGMWY